MKICFYTFTFLPTVGGAENILHGLAESLVSRRHEVTVWAPYVRHKDNKVSTSYRLCRYHRPMSKRFGVRQTMIYLAWEYWKNGMDILHCHGAYPAAYVGATAKRFFHIPMVARPHGADILPGEWIRQNPRLERRMKGALMSADHIVAQGTMMRNEILELGIPPERISVIHNGVKNEKINTGRPAGNYFFSMGSLSWKKGYDILIRAFAQISFSFPDIRLRIAGDGSRREDLLNLAASLTIQNKIDWLGEIGDDKKQQELAGALAYVCPSRREPFSNALLESLAAGLPVIATRTGGNTEIIEDGVSGTLVEPERPDGLADAMKKIIQDVALRKTLAAGAVARARLFDWELMVDRYETLYQNIFQAQR